MDWRCAMEQINNMDVTKIKWSHPMGHKELSQIFEVHRNTIAKWLKNQVICNRHLSARRWEVAIFELPYNLEEDKISDIA
jgi:hypothetical protein